MNEKIDKAMGVVKGKIPALTVQADIQKAGQAVLNLAQAKALYAGFSKPTKDLDEELDFVLGRVRSNLGATELQQVTQAALHLASAKALHEGAAASQAKPTRTTKGAGS